jgi:hypothetical protein
MSSPNIINDVIKEPIKNPDIVHRLSIVNNPFLLNDKKKQTEKTKDDTSFQQILSLQLLIQKYLGLKELCKKIIY